jgi:uncharacterized protein
MGDRVRRYTTRLFPSYAFIPGQTPHPRRNRQGHSYGKPDPKPPAFPLDQWRTSEDYRYAVDLYNAGYWWECHEILEGLWHAFGKTTEQGSFFQALIDLAASHLKLTMNAPAASMKLQREALARLEKVPSPYMGLDVRDLERRIHRKLAELSLPAVHLRLML